MSEVLNLLSLDEGVYSDGSGDHQSDDERRSSPSASD